MFCSKATYFCFTNNKTLNKMRTINLNKIVLLIFGLFLMTTLSCRGSDDNSGGGGSGVPAGKCSIKMSYTGNASGNFNNDVNISATTNVQGMVMMVGVKLLSNTTTEQFTITLPANTKTGTYTISQLVDNMGTFAYISNSSDTNNNSYVAGADGDNNFTVTITTSGNGKMEGTFKGDMFNINGKKINVNGEFQGSY